MPVNEYFGSAPKDKVVDALMQLERDTWSILESRNVPLIWREITAQAFSLREDGVHEQGLQYADPDNSAIKFRINLTRPHLQQQIIMVQGKHKISFAARAINSDVTALASVNTAAKAMDYVVASAQLDQVGYRALEYNGFYGVGSIWVRWDYDGGEMVDAMIPALDEQGKPVMDEGVPGEVDPQTGAVLTPAVPPKPMKVKGKKRSGAPKYSALAPWQRLSDTVLSDSPWTIIKEPISKWELAAKFPEHEKDILGGSTLDRTMGDMEMFGWSLAGTPKDIVILRHFYHRHSDAVPGGRWVGYCAGKLLWDVASPISQGLPIVDISTAQYVGTQIGYPQVTDLLSLQDAFTEVASQVITNTMRFGNQNLYVPKGSDYDRDAIARGGAFLEIPDSQNPPKAIEYASMSPAAKYILDMCPKLMSDISGLNSTVRGQPESNISSGVFAALMVNIAESFQSPTQLIYDQAITKLGNMSLELIRNNADNGFIAEVAGAANQAYMRHFTADSFSGVHKVQMVRKETIADSFPARMEIVNAVIRLPRDIQMKAFTMLLTGNTDALVEDDHSQSILINYENEQMLNGEIPEPLITDNHKLHAPSHRASLDRLRAQPKPQPGSPEALRMEMAIKAHLAHLSLHGQQWASGDAVMGSMMGTPPVPPEVMAQMAPPPLPSGNGQPPGPGAPMPIANGLIPKPQTKLPEPAGLPRTLDRNSVVNQ